MLAPGLLCSLGLLMALGTVLAAPSAAEEVKLQRGPCPAQWFAFDGRCYKYVPSPLTWDQAERNCASEHGHLASVHGDEEHTFVRRLIKNFDPQERLTWIGLSGSSSSSSQGERDEWAWSDGSAAAYTAWAAGQPNGAGRRDCVYTNCFSRWCDWSCSAPYPSVCELTH